MAAAHLPVAYCSPCLAMPVNCQKRSEAGSIPAGDTLLPPEHEDAGERLIEVLLISIAVSGHILSHLRSTDLKVAHGMQQLVREACQDTSRTDSQCILHRSVVSTEQQKCVCQVSSSATRTHSIAVYCGMGRLCFQSFIEAIS